jgi:hypothetical protein
MAPRSRIPSTVPSSSTPGWQAHGGPTSSSGTPASHSFGQTPVLQRQPANEDPALRRRRLDAAVAARTAIDRLTRALDRGYLLPGEVVAADGRIEAAMEQRVETRAVRDTRLRELIRDLRGLVVDLETGPVDSVWFEETIETEHAIFGVGGSQVWQDTAALYLHRNFAGGKSLPDSFENVLSIQIEPIPTPAVQRSPVGRASGIGIYLIVEDRVNAPLNYRRLTGYEGWQERGEIVEVWSDDFGYFYWGSEGRKVYLPGRP